MEINFTGKRILVTGATRGIGRGIARLLHKLGGTVIAVCCNKTFLDELKAEIAAKSMIERGTGGAIVNLASVVGIFPMKEMPIYCALKEATINLTKSMALDLAKHKIRVNSVAPGAVRTDQAKMLTESEALMKVLVEKVPIGRIIEPEEIAKVVAFLLSEHSSVITGVTLPVDGGFLLNPPVLDGIGKDVPPTLPQRSQ